MFVNQLNYMFRPFHLRAAARAWTPRRRLGGLHGAAAAVAEGPGARTWDGSKSLQGGMYHQFV